jgi:hypothetical protein
VCILRVRALGVGGGLPRTCRNFGRCLPSCGGNLPGEQDAALLTGLRKPTHADKVYRDECMFSFDTPFSEGGLYLNLSTFQVGSLGAGVSEFWLPWFLLNVPGVGAVWV